MLTMKCGSKRCQKPKHDILGGNFAENGTLTEYTKTDLNQQPLYYLNPLTLSLLLISYDNFEDKSGHELSKVICFR